MENLEQENHELHNEVTTLKADMVNMDDLVGPLVAVQNQPPLVEPQQTIIASEGLSVPISITPVTVAYNCMP